MPKLRPDVSDFLSYTLGWNKLREIQSKAIPEILSGNNVLLIASTAAGKTEASMIPLLNLMLENRVSNLSCIYFAPLRALINDIYERLNTIFSPFGLEVCRWHGEILQSEKNRAKKSAQILVTTPESMDGILTSRIDKKEFLGQLRYVVIDEVHNFIDGPRGAQLSSLIERLDSISEHEIQRIAMSATVGNPQILSHWLTGSSQRKTNIITDGGTRKKEIEVYHIDEKNPDDYISELLERETGTKLLVFAYSRAQAEEFAGLLGTRGISAPVHHSSISKSLREMVEEDFKNNNNLRVVVATSTLELGINIGDVDRVIFLEVPDSNSSFLQRIGRSGRKRLFAKATIFMNDPMSHYRMMGILQLLNEDRVEGIHPVEYFPQLLAHQLISLSYQDGVINKRNINSLRKAYPFSAIGTDDFKKICGHLIKSGYLNFNDRKELIPGSETHEAIENGKNKMDFVVVFPARSQFLVVNGGLEIGYLHPAFVGSLSDLVKTEDPTFLLCGKPWKIIGIDENRKIIEVKPGKVSKTPSWISPGTSMTFDFARAIRGWLENSKIPEYVNLSSSSSDALLGLRDYELGIGSVKTEITYLETTRRKRNFLTLVTYFGDSGNQFMKYSLKAIQPELTNIKTSWREIILETDISSGELDDSLKGFMNSGEENIIKVLENYFYNNEDDMEQFFKNNDDKLQKYIPDNIKVSYIARQLFDERIVELLSK